MITAKDVVLNVIKNALELDYNTFDVNMKPKPAGKHTMPLFYAEHGDAYCDNSIMGCSVITMLLDTDTIYITTASDGKVMYCAYGSPPMDATNRLMKLDIMPD